MAASIENQVTVTESGNGPYAQFVTAGHHVMGADEPETFGGRDTGASPYEYVAAGLGACTAMTIRMYASRHAWPLQRISVTVRHARTAGDRAGDHFERIIDVGGDLSESQRARLLEIAEKCPVSQTLRRPSSITSSLTPPLRSPVPVGD
jgi:putative redox protein